VDGDLSYEKDRVILRYFSQDWELPCKFLKDNECLIYDIRPVACRDFPFREEGYKSTCIGIKDGSKKKT